MSHPVCAFIYTEMLEPAGRIWLTNNVSFEMFYFIWFVWIIAVRDIFFSYFDGFRLWFSDEISDDPESDLHHTENTDPSKESQDPA